MIGICAFCHQGASLQLSHILPAFIYRWLKQRSGGGGYIRSSENVNRRIQDGLKVNLLCKDCEGLFNRFETEFATKLFHPWLNGENQISYGDWLLKFCVSVSWRVLRYVRGRNKEPMYSQVQEALMDQAEIRWRAFLNNKTPHPGEFKQHLLILDIIENTTIPDLPSNINRYMSGAITLDIVGSETSLMTFAKLGRFIIFGVIQNGSNKWEGTKVHVKKGLLKPGRFVIPAGLIELFKEKAAQSATAFDAISQKQALKIDQHVIKNLDRFVTSDQFRSIAADARMFGEDAIATKKE